MKTLLGILIVTLLLSGCSARHVNEPRQDTTPVRDKQDSPDLSIGFHPLKDDPDNPSPHNPLIKKFGDVPEVRAYMRLKQKIGRGIGLNIDEAIELYTAEVYLYPTPDAKEMLKSLKKDKQRYQRLGIPLDRSVLMYTPIKENLPPPDFVLVNPLKDDPDNPSPHNPLIKKFGDIPEVRTYMRLKQKLVLGIGLNTDEAIEFYTAEVHLYPTPRVKAALKSMKKDKERYQRLGIPMDGPVLRYNTKADPSGENSAANASAD